MRHNLPVHETIGADGPDLHDEGDCSGAGTELWFARRLAREHGETLKFVWPWRSWMAWQPEYGRWQRDAGAAAWSAAKTSVQRLLAEAGAVAGQDDAKGKLLLKAARRFMSRSALEAALKLAQSEAAVVATPDDWDAHPHLLNCANGTVDLRTGRLHPHRSEDRLTKTTGVMFTPDAPAPRWHAFLERILPDADLRAWLQRSLGYTAFGSVTEHVLFVFWGGGANGKSVLCGTVAKAFGEYAVSVPPTLLVNAANFTEHPTIRTILYGARFALASETAENGRFDEAAVKSLTGGDRIRARGMRENWWEFAPTHTLFLQTNNRPRVRETTVAVWRRLKLVPFTVTIPPAQQDRTLAHALASELPGVLAWIVAGAVAYQREGLEPPAIVATVTAEYQASEDPFREFIERYEPVGFTSCEDLHASYRLWAESTGLKPWGQRTLTGKLRDRGWQYLEHHRPRGFAVSPVPNGFQPLSSREASRVETKQENTVPNGDGRENPHSKPLPGQSRNGDALLNDLEARADREAEKERRG